MGRTTISASDELADKLYDMKRRGESYEDVVWRLIEHYEQVDAEKPPDQDADVEPDPAPDQEAEAVEPPGSIPAIVDALDKRLTGAKRDGLVAALDFLREEGDATTSEIVPVGFDAAPDAYASEKSWRSNLWNNVTGELQEMGVLELTNKSRGRWRWVGE